MTAHAVIEKSRSKKKPFKMNLIAKNGEPIQAPQLLTTRNNCKKNLRAVIAMCDGKMIWVVDKTDTRYKPHREFYLHKDGFEEEI